MAYIFDDTAYRERVAPAVRRFVHTGAADEWLDRLLHPWAEEWLVDVGTFSLFSSIRALGFSFDAVCDYLGPDFAFGGSEVDQWSPNWEPRACRSRTCPAKEKCPLHQSQELEAANEFNFLLTDCILDQCLGPGQIVGRTGPLWYSDILLAAGFSKEHALFDSLRKLEYRGFVVGFRFANSDGIHGWLSAGETKAFHTFLQGLDLPQFEPSFQAMESLLHADVVPPPYSWKQLSLAFLRTVAGMAVGEARGLLWGNDLPAAYAGRKRAGE